MVDKINISVSKDQSKIRLDRYLLCQGVGPTRSRIQKLIESGSVLVNGTARPPGYFVKPGDRIAVAQEPQARERPGPAAQDIPLEVVYEDGDLMVINKPAGMVVHPAPGNYSGTLVNALLGRRGALSPGTGRDRPGILHRLDKDTSGLLIVARNEQAHARLAAQLMARRIQRTYLALAWGAAPDQGTVNAPVGRSAFDRKKMDVTALRGREAVTRYRTVERFGRTATLLEVRLETGRTHQIRVHLEHIGHPVVGDPSYDRGRRDILARLPRKQREVAEGAAGLMRRQALHAAGLKFHHPGSGQPMAFSAPLPDDMEKILGYLRGI